MTVKENKMGTTPVFKLLISMAFPMIISMLIHSLYNVVDSIFVGKFSNDALTAIGLAFPMQNLIIALATGFGVGVNAILSKSLGERNHVKASKTAINGCILMLIVYLIFILVGFTCLPKYMMLQTSNQSVIDFGVTYLKYIVIGCVFLLFSITLERLLQSTGRTFLVMIAQLSGTIVNIILDPILIFGLCGFKPLGIDGAAIATLIGQFTSFVFAFLLNIKYNKDLHFNKEVFSLGSLPYIFS